MPPSWHSTRESEVCCLKCMDSERELHGFSSGYSSSSSYGSQMQMFCKCYTNAPVISQLHFWHSHWHTPRSCNSPFAVRQIAKYDALSQVSKRFLFTLFLLSGLRARPWQLQCCKWRKERRNISTTFSFIEIEQIPFFNKPFYSKCKILMFDSSYVTGCLLLCKQKYHLFLSFFFFFLIFYFKTCSKDLNNADPAPKGNGFWKSQYNFKILRLINDI